MSCLDAFGEVIEPLSTDELCADKRISFQMPLMMLGRPILHKQTSFGFYRPGAVALANTLADIPFSATRIFVYNVIVYL